MFRAAEQFQPRRRSGDWSSVKASLILASIRLFGLVSVVVALTGYSISAADAAPTGKYLVSATAPKKLMLTGTAFVFSGTVSPKRPGQQVFVQRRSGSKWLTVAKVRQNSSGRYSSRTVESAAGYHQYRGYVPGDKSRAAGASNPVGVSTARWHYLSDTNSAEYGGTACCSYPDNGAVQINGSLYAHTENYHMSGNDDSGATLNIQWNLARRCYTFESTLGLNDASPSSGSAGMGIQLDQTDRFNQVFTFGETKRVTLDVRGNLRIGLVGTVTYDQGVDAAFGNARILCGF